MITWYVLFHLPTGISREDVVPGISFPYAASHARGQTIEARA